VELSHGFADALREELDLRIEARNMTSVAAASGDQTSVHVPVPHAPLCGETVLVMEYLDGRPLAAVDAGLPAEARTALARSLAHPAGPRLRHGRRSPPFRLRPAR
jgi:ubiquinone biosynthesis protein